LAPFFQSLEIGFKVFIHALGKVSATIADILFGAVAVLLALAIDSWFFGTAKLPATIGSSHFWIVDVSSCRSTKGPALFLGEVHLPVSVPAIQITALSGAFVQSKFPIGEQLLVFE